MPKAIYRSEYNVFLTLLKDRRLNAGMTQAQCSIALGRPQSFISDVERGIRRLDIIQIYDLCNVLGCDFTDLIRDFVDGISTSSRLKDESVEVGHDICNE